MGQADIIQTISFIFFGLSVLFLLLAVVLFFRLEIMEVIGYITGSTARKQIAAYNEQTHGQKTMSGRLQNKKKKEKKYRKIQEPAAEGPSEGSGQAEQGKRELSSQINIKEETSFYEEYLKEETEFYEEEIIQEQSEEKEDTELFEDTEDVNEKIPERPEENVTEFFMEQAEGENTDLYTEPEDTEETELCHETEDIEFQIVDEETQLSSEEDIL